MLYFQTCPKCQTGAMEYGKDIWGFFFRCLHCGYYVEDSRSVSLKKRLATPENSAVYSTARALSRLSGPRPEELKEHEEVS